MTATKPPSFEFFRDVARKNVLQVRDPLTGAPIPATELSCYVAKCWLDTPYNGIMLPRGSKLFLTAATAAPMLEAGKIEPHLSEVLIRRREPPK